MPHTSHSRLHCPRCATGAGAFPHHTATRPVARVTLPARAAQPPSGGSFTLSLPLAAGAALVPCSTGPRGPGDPAHASQTQRLGGSSRLDASHTLTDRGSLAPWRHRDTCQWQALAHDAARASLAPRAAVPAPRAIALLACPCGAPGKRRGRRRRRRRRRAAALLKDGDGNFDARRRRIHRGRRR